MSIVCRGFLYIVSFWALSAAAVGVGQSTVGQSMVEQQLIERGRASFVRRCSGCHGQQADGNGPAADMLNPRPRNLNEGAFKFRSTPSGSLPTTHDLLRTINQGVLGTSMPPFNLVSDQEKLALVAYIKSLREEFRNAYPNPVTIGAPPPFLRESQQDFVEAAKRGYVHYKKLCAQCHGPRGRGKGPSAATLVDMNDRKILPADLSKPYIKSGRTAQDMFKAITTGLDGSPMPGFLTSLTENERWEVVALALYMRGQRRGMFDSEEDFLDPEVGVEPEPENEDEDLDSEPMDETEVEDG